MGILDLFKPKRSPPPKIEDLFKLPPVSVALESLNVHPTGKCGVCFRSIGAKSYDELKAEIVRILENNAFPARYGVSKDEYGFTWAVIDGDSLPDAVANVYLASQLLIEGGLSDHILVAIFRFDRDGRPVYWVYNYRRASFYPFAPHDKERDSSLEYRLRLRAMGELPVDSLDYWFPIWGIPF